jgi:hypothetical protein
MAAWARTADGFAANLDGSDAAAGFSLPRLELRSGAGGWECSCLLADGTSVRLGGVHGSIATAKAALVERARAVLGGRWAAALAGLAGPGA